MSQNQDPISAIAQLIETKSKVKQQTFRSLCETFKEMKLVAKAVVEKINSQINSKDKDISIKVINVSDHEFHIKMAGDLLIFIMHTNIVTLDPNHGFNKSEYVQESPLRKYLGQINVYNFMSDSLTYNRLNDPGYLVARLSMNYEKHFLVEGEKQLSFMFDSVSKKPISKTDINIIIQLVLSQAIDSDLVTRPFPEIRAITLNEKILKTRALGGGYKIGFQMTSSDEIK